MKRLKILLLCGIILILLAGCSSKFVDDRDAGDVTLREAIYLMRTGDSIKAIDLFKKVESNYASENNSIEAQLFLIWIYFKTNQLDMAESVASSFIKFYPYNKYTSWVEYMLSIIDYEQIAKPERDSSIASKTLTLFNGIINKYPDSDYAKDVIFKRSFVISVLADDIMNVGRYYLRHKDYIGAIYRFQEIKDHYSRTRYVPEALYRLVYSYLSIGLKDPALAEYRLLKYNFPNSPWVTHSSDVIREFNTDKKIKADDGLL